jgi:uncharacterized SAM-binding protein YcdF (DUF218 family)
MVLLRRLRALLAGLGTLVMLVTITPLTGWWGRLLSGHFNDPSGDLLVILASDDLPDGIPGVASYWRAVYGARAWHQGGFRQIVVSGRPAASIRDFLVAEGVPMTAILLEARSNSTRENALNAKPLLDASPGRKVLLTSDYHMFRALGTFRKAGATLAPRPIPDIEKRVARWSGRWGAFLDLWVETLKIAGYYVRGWI